VPLPGDQSHVTNGLAQFVAGSQWETIPSEVRRAGVRGLLNFVGCALGGAQDEAMGIAVKVLTPFFGPPQGIVIGRGDRPDALNAAFLNAVSANVLEYDDTHLGTVMHPAAPVAPGLFALAGLRQVSGRELLHAFILGVEVSCRVGLGVMPTHYRRGWHITATCGIFGGGRRLRSPARARRAAHGLGPRPCRNTIRKPRRKHWQHDEKPRRRQRREERAGRGAVRRGRV
jgi:2-methylcitrate dehydratase PrpD